MAEAIRVLPLHNPLSSFSSSSLIGSSASTLSCSLQLSPTNHSLVKRVYNQPCSSSSSGRDCSGFSHVSVDRTRKQLLSSFEVHSTVAEANQPKWWEKNPGPNMIDIHSTEEFLSALSEAGDRLVIAEFYGTWCASCRALFPKLCKTAEEHPEISFLKVNFDENKPMCKSLNVRVLPYFHFYRGAHGQLDHFSCSLTKFQKIKDAIELHNTVHCSFGPTKAAADLSLEIVSTPINKTDGGAT